MALSINPSILYEWRNITYHESQVVVFGKEQLLHLQMALSIHSPLNPYSPGTIRAPLFLRFVRRTVNLTVTGIHFVRVESLHREVLAAVGTLEALLVEDFPSDGSHPLRGIDTFLATKTSFHLLQRDRSQIQIEA